MPRLVPCALSVLLLVSACTDARSSDSPRTAGPPTVAPNPTAGRSERPRPRPPVVFFLGDSYTVGTKDSPAKRTYAAETARRLGWQVVIAGKAGTGFLETGKGSRTFSGLYDDQLAWRPTPDMVVVSGGRNDHEFRPRDVGPAAARLLTKIQVRWPRTRVLMIGPLWGGDPPATALRVRDAIQRAAADTWVPFVDPLRGRWITGNRDKKTGNAARYILDDGTHPTLAGNRYLADRLIAELRRLRLDRPRQRRP